MAMTWNSRYTISNKLLLTIREIGESIGEIRAQYLTHTALAKLGLSARELSSYASTSIEGNPLPLTDVKRLLKTGKESIRDTEREVLLFLVDVWALIIVASSCHQEYRATRCTNFPSLRQVNSRFKP